MVVVDFFSSFSSCCSFCSCLSKWEGKNEWITQLIKYSKLDFSTNKTAFDPSKKKWERDEIKEMREMREKGVLEKMREMWIEEMKFVSKNKYEFQFIHEFNQSNRRIQTSIKSVTNNHFIFWCIDFMNHFHHLPKKTNNNNIKNQKDEKIKKEEMLSKSQQEKIKEEWWKEERWKKKDENKKKK